MEELNRGIYILPQEQLSIVDESLEEDFSWLDETVKNKT